MLYNDALQLSITRLKGWGYLKPNQIKSGTLNWSRNGNPTGSISILVNTCNEQPYIELKYSYKDEPRKYKVFLTSSASNLNNGKLLYFLCPKTNKRCRKLYSINGYFLHREAFKDCMYESQIHSKRNRNLFKRLDPYFKRDDLYSELYKKNFKKTYAGKPTKKYLRLMEQILKAESIPYHEIERAMIR